MEDLRGNSNDWGFSYQAPNPTSVWDLMGNAVSGMGNAASSWSNWRFPDTSSYTNELWDWAKTSPLQSIPQMPEQVQHEAFNWSPGAMSGIITPLNQGAGVLLNRTYNEFPGVQGMFNWLQKRPEDIGVIASPIREAAFGQYFSPTSLNTGGLVKVDPRMFFNHAANTLTHELGHASEALMYPLGFDRGVMGDFMQLLEQQAPHVSSAYFKEGPEHLASEYFTRALTDRMFGKPTLAGFKPWTMRDQIFGGKTQDPRSWMPSPIEHLKNLLYGTGKPLWEGPWQLPRNQ